MTTPNPETVDDSMTPERLIEDALVDIRAVHREQTLPPFEKMVREMCPGVYEGMRVPNYRDYAEAKLLAALVPGLLKELCDTKALLIKARDWARDDGYGGKFVGQFSNGVKSIEATEARAAEVMKVVEGVE